jgi:glycosyltransferase involved in cell wall biosynthesis
MKFSVCISVYKNDNPTEFRSAFDSIINQTVPPSEIVLVEDGPVSGELELLVKEIESQIEILKVIRLPKNVGHAGARQAAMNAATNDLVAIMDADDISVNNRFELQLKAYTLRTDSAVIGGQIKEFVGEQTNVVGERIVPENDKDIKAYLKSRCPMNFVTVMYRKSAVENVGGFIDWYCEEDYYLWIRLAQQGYKFYNLPDNLVNVRVGEEMYQRRGGWRYFKSEARLQRYMLNHHIISLPQYLYNVIGRFVLQVAMPNKIRGVIFQKLLRKN